MQSTHSKLKGIHNKKVEDSIKILTFFQKRRGVKFQGSERDFFIFADFFCLCVSRESSRLDVSWDDAHE